MAPLWEFQDFSYNAPLGICASPSLDTTTFTIASPPFILPRDWSDSTYLTTDSTGHIDYDFQSNHTIGCSPLVPASLAGLGIKNVYVDLAHESNGNNSGQPCVADGDALSTLSRREDVDDEQLDLLLHYPGCYNPDGYLSGLGSPWSFSSVLKATELAAADTSTDLASSGSVDLECSGLTPRPPVHVDTDNDASLSFEQLSASTGLSIAEFAAQLSATAEATLQRMASGGLGEENDNSFEFQSNLGEATPRWSVPQLFLPSGEINLRYLPSSWNDNSEGVNLADILPPPSPIVELSIPEPPTSQFSLAQSGQVFPSDTVSEDFSNTAPNVHDLVMSVDLQAPALESRNLPYELPPPEQNTQHRRQLSDDEHSFFQSPSSSDYSPSLSFGGQKKSALSRNSKRRVTRSRISEASACTSPEPQAEFCDQGNLPDIDLGTPVFDAHRGVDIEFLKSKAERYRLRNQGRDYDKRWLISFAGKLSARGELVEEFRCYVSGCKQTNKRRDHILIHVGAHLDQRPFKCMYCSSRFLRKNECKRHELSHTGIRPFSCPLCPFPSTTFVRQDLLKRHMKRTHRADLKVDKENEDPGMAYRPKKRARF